MVYLRLLACAVFSDCDAPRQISQNTPEEELPVQVANVDRVHVDDMDVLETGKRKVRKDLAA